MIAVSPPLTDPRRRHERLSNWLALLALLAGGIVFQDADEATKAGSSAAALRPSSATASSPDIATRASASGAACAE